MVATYRARRRIKVGPTLWREPGELVPEAHTWFRVGSFEHTGFLEAVEVDEAELRTAMADQQLAPEVVAQIESITGLDGTPVRTAPRPEFKRAPRAPKQRKAAFEYAEEKS